MGEHQAIIKADFESVAFVCQNEADYFLILSSGSKKVMSDIAYLFSLSTKKVWAKRNLRPWYNSIKEQSGMSADHEINVEGSVVMDGRIYIVHRGNVSGKFLAAFSLK